MGLNIAARGAPIRLPPNCSGRGLRALRASFIPRGLPPGEKFWRARNVRTHVRVGNGLSVAHAERSHGGHASLCPPYAPAGRNRSLVMPGLDPGIHAVTAQQVERPMEWIAGSARQ